MNHRRIFIVAAIWCCHVWVVAQEKYSTGLLYADDDVDESFTGSGSVPIVSLHHEMETITGSRSSPWRGHADLEATERSDSGIDFLDSSELHSFQKSRSRGSQHMDEKAAVRLQDSLKDLRGSLDQLFLELEEVPSEEPTAAPTAAPSPAAHTFTPTIIPSQTAPTLFCTLLVMEGFETDGNTLSGGSRYTTSPEESSNGGSAFFARTDLASLTLGSNFIGGIDGTHYFGARNTDDAPTPSSTVSITFASVNIEGYSELEFSGLFGSDSPVDVWDSSCAVDIEYSIDGGDYELALSFRTAVDGTVPLEDRDLDGVGDTSGVALTQALNEFTASLSGTGSSLSLRIRAENLNGFDEDIAFDEIRITGCEGISFPPTQQPTPTDAPTQQPTPTDAPTPQPTPTDAPTQQPTPTDAPTQQPTQPGAPTPQPTPTDAPTQQPTPTDAPTQQPTFAEVSVVFDSELVTTGHSSDSLGYDMTPLVLDVLSSVSSLSIDYISVVSVSIIPTDISSESLLRGSFHRKLQNISSVFDILYSLRFEIPIVSNNASVAAEVFSSATSILANAVVSGNMVSEMVKSASRFNVSLSDTFGVQNMTFGSFSTSITGSNSGDDDDDDNSGSSDRNGGSGDPLTEGERIAWITGTAAAGTAIVVLGIFSIVFLSGEKRERKDKIGIETETLPKVSSELSLQLDENDLQMKPSSSSSKEVLDDDHMFQIVNGGKSSDSDIYHLPTHESVDHEPVASLKNTDEEGIKDTSIDAKGHFPHRYPPRRSISLSRRRAGSYDDDSQHSVDPAVAQIYQTSSSEIDYIVSHNNPFSPPRQFALNSPFERSFSEGSERIHIGNFPDLYSRSREEEFSSRSIEIFQRGSFDLSDVDDQKGICLHSGGERKHLFGNSPSPKNSSAHDQRDNRMLRYSSLFGSTDFDSDASNPLARHGRRRDFPESRSAVYESEGNDTCDNSFLEEGFGISSKRLAQEYLTADSENEDEKLENCKSKMIEESFGISSKVLAEDYSIAESEYDREENKLAEDSSQQLAHVYWNEDSQYENEVGYSTPDGLQASPSNYELDSEMNVSTPSGSGTPVSSNSPESLSKVIRANLETPPVALRPRRSRRKYPPSAGPYITPRMHEKADSSSERRKRASIPRNASRSSLVSSPSLALSLSSRNTSRSSLVNSPPLALSGSSGFLSSHSPSLNRHSPLRLSARAKESSPEKLLNVIDNKVPRSEMHEDESDVAIRITMTNSFDSDEVMETPDNRNFQFDTFAGSAPSSGKSPAFQSQVMDASPVVTSRKAMTKLGESPVERDGRAFNRRELRQSGRNLLESMRVENNELDCVDFDCYSADGEDSVMDELFIISPDPSPSSSPIVQRKKSDIEESVGDEAV